MPKIELTDTPMNIAIKMSSGNPGALNVIAAIFKQGAEIDPQSFMGSLAPIMDMDELGIYGSSIYVFWKDICGGNLPNMLAVLRAVQLGKFSGEVLKDAVSRQDRSGKALVPVEVLCAEVKAYLPQFNFFPGSAETAKV